MAGVKQPLLSDKGSRSTYAVHFQGQVFRKFGDPKAVLTNTLVVSAPTGNLTILCLRFNLLVLLRKPGQSSLRLLACMWHSGIVRDTGTRTCTYIYVHVCALCCTMSNVEKTSMCDKCQLQYCTDCIATHTCDNVTVL